MNLHEFQGKKILAEHGVNIQRGYVLSDKKNTLKVLILSTKENMLILKQNMIRSGLQLLSTEMYL